MNILLVSATQNEILPFYNAAFSLGNHNLRLLVTGAGIVQTVWELSKELNAPAFHCDLAINAGIAGSFDSSLEKGAVVEVISDCFADFGAQDGASFISAFELGIGGGDNFPFKNNHLFASYSLNLSFPKVNGITVNTVSGNEDCIRQRKLLHSAQIESMEGAAFFYCCLATGVPCLQLRSISNPIEKRNRINWNIPLAVLNLNSALKALLLSLE